MSDPLDDVQIEQLLASAVVARLGCHADGRTYVVPVSYAYYGGACYGHMSDGLKLRMLRVNPAVCLEVDRVQNLSRWESVIAWGTFEELSGEAAREGAELFLQRIYTVLTGYAAGNGELGRMVKDALVRGVVYRIRLAEKTGRIERGGVAAAWLAVDSGGRPLREP